MHLRERGSIEREIIRPKCLEHMYYYIRGCTLLERLLPALWSLPRCRFLWIRFVFFFFPSSAFVAGPFFSRRRSPLFHLCPASFLFLSLSLAMDVQRKSLVYLLNALRLLKTDTGISQTNEFFTKKFRVNWCREAFIYIRLFKNKVIS